MSSSSVVVDVLYSLARGLRDCVRPAILLFSVLVWGCATAVCGLVFLLAWRPLWQVAQGLVQMGWQTLVGWWEVLAPAGNIVVPVTTGLVLLLAAVLLVIIAVRIALEFWLMDRVRGVILAGYPQLQRRSARLGTEVSLFVRQLISLVVLAPVFLVLPLIGGPLWFAFGAYLMARGLMVDALQGVADDRELTELPGANRPGLLLIGCSLSLLLLVPPLSLIAPALLACCVCHFAFRRLESGRAEASRVPAAPDL